MNVTTQKTKSKTCGQTKKHPQSVNHQVMLFTYTDKDGFVPPSDVDGGGLTTGDGGQFSHLEEAVVNMPRRAGSSLLKAASGRGRAGGLAGTPGGGSTLGGNRGISETAAAMQAHLAREDKFKARRFLYTVFFFDMRNNCNAYHTRRNRHSLYTCKIIFKKIKKSYEEEEC